MDDIFWDDDYSTDAPVEVDAPHWSGLSNVGGGGETYDYSVPNEMGSESTHWSGLSNVGGDGAAYGSEPGGLSSILGDVTKALTSKDAQDLFKLVMGGMTAYDALKRWKSGPQGYKTPAELISMIPGGAASARTWAPGTFSNGQTRAFQFSDPQKAGSQLARVYADSMRNPVVPGKRYAEGGDVMMEDPMMEEPMPEEPEGALAQVLGSQGEPFVGYVPGAGGGQSDTIQAWLSPGEYVWDADTVSALGDGNNEEGARRLDEAREAIRTQKRAAPADEIPPPADHPLAYIEGGE